MDAPIILPSSTSLMNQLFGGLEGCETQVTEGIQNLALVETIIQALNGCINSLIAAIAEALFITTPGGIIYAVNQPACTLVGYRAEELVGRSLSLIAASSPFLTEADFETLQNKGAVQNLEKRLKTRAGQEIPVSLSCTLHCDRPNQAQWIVYIVQDLPQKQQTVEACNETAARNTALLKAIPDLILRMSRSGICLDIVPTEGLWSSDIPLIGKHLSELLPSEVAQQYLHSVEQALQTREIQLSESFLWVNGQLRYQEARVVANGSDEALIIIRDVTERKKTEEVNALLATIVEQGSEAIAIANANAEIEYINPAFEDLTGFNQAELFHQSLYTALCNARQNANAYEQILQTLATGQVWQDELVAAHKNGSLYQQETVILPVRNHQGNLINYVVVSRDITQRRQTEAALKRYQLLSQHTRDIVLFMRPNGQIVDANDAAVQAYHYSREELLGLKFHDLHDSASAALLEDQMLQAQEHGLLFEATHQRKDKTLFTAEVSVQGALIDQETLLLSIIRDITNRKRTEENLFRSAFHDSLTNLPNRTFFLERLRQALQHDRSLFAVLFLDLDRFKVINDSLGHLAGDQLLVAIAERLVNCLKPEDTLARFGGDEFTILLENIQDLSQATQVAERIQQELAHPFQLNGQDVYTTTSIGIVLSTIGWTQPEEFIRSADTALYRSKAMGGTRYVVFDAEMHSHALARLHLETDLRRALAETPIHEPIPAAEPTLDSEFQVYYQPIISLRTLRISGFEALLRWQHPERGLVSPNEFIPLAEETGLIIPIGWIALRQACAQMHTWQVQFPTHPPLWISVNLSVKQFSQPNLVAQIRQILQETGLSPNSLKLEITESAIVENAEAATRMLRELHALGVQLSLDDFGTGYSSLSYLHRFPIDTLKIDRSFINQVDTDGEQLEIVRTLVTLAWNIGIDVVAEGVETNKQLAQLRALRCEYGQGYLFSKPVHSQAATALISAV